MFNGLAGKWRISREFRLFLTKALYIFFERFFDMRRSDISKIQVILSMTVEKKIRKVVV